MTNVNWHVFTQEERTLIQQAIDSGDNKNIACLIDGVNMDQEKEAEIQKIVDDLSPEDDNFVSEVEDEIKKEFLEKVPEPDKTPEQEAEWQAKLDAERAEFVEKTKKKKGRPSKKPQEEIIINKDETVSKETVKSDK